MDLQTRITRNIESMEQTEHILSSPTDRYAAILLATCIIGGDQLFLPIQNRCTDTVQLVEKQENYKLERVMSEHHSK